MDKKVKMKKAVSDAEMMQIMLDTMPLNATIFDRNLNIIECNQQALNMFCLSNKQEYLENFYSLFPERQLDGRLSIEMTAEHIEKAFYEGYHHAEWIHENLNGDQIPCDVTLVRIKFKGDDVVAGYSRDLRELKTTIEKIRDAEVRTRVMFDSTPLNINLFDSDINIIDCNQETMYTFELSDKQEFLDDFYAFSPKYQPNGKLTKEMAAEVGSKALEEGYAVFEWMHQKKNGELIPCEVTLIRIIYRGENALAGYSRDLREIKAKEKEADEAVERTQIMLDATPLCCSLIDSNYNFIDCNNEAVNLFGVSGKHEYLNGFFGFSPQFQPDGQNSQDKAFGLFKKTFEEGYARSDWLHINKAGEFIPSEVTLTRVKYKDDYIIAAYTFDVRDVKNAVSEMEKAIKEKNALKNLENILNNLNVMIYVTDPKTNKILFTSDGMKHHYGITKDVTGQKCYETFQKGIDERCPFCPCVQLDIEPGRAVIWEEHSTITGRVYQNFDRYINWLDGRIVHLQNSVDITELNETKEQAIQASKAKSGFLARVSHEIRTPMNAILGITEIQLLKEDLSRDLQESLETIYSSGYLLLAIINDILDLSKIEAGKLELAPVQYDFASLVSDTVQLNIARYDSKQIEFILEVDENIPSVLFGDELRIKQILNNVLSNAFKYTEKGNVSLSIYIEPDSELNSGKDKSINIIFRVSDTGQGMTPDEVEKLFTEYMRFNAEANRKTEGTGLGINIARNLAKMMNGDIFVESERDKGSVFTVILPQITTGSGILGKETTENLKNFRSGKMSQIKKAPQIFREYMPYGRVLVVDDVETNLFVIQGLLTPYGVSCETVLSGFEAVEKIKNGFSYDIIFMDHFMPKMDGMETTEIIRNLGYKNPIIALTANAMSGQAEMLMGNGFDGFISKPIDIRLLNATLNKFIRDKYPARVVESARKLKEIMVMKIEEIDLMQSEDIRLAFVRDAEKAISVLELVHSYNFRRDDDIQSYIIYAHAIKGALSNIGETELSASALVLERAGREGKTSVLKENTAPFISDLRALIKKIQQKENEDETPEDDNLTDSDKAFLREKLTVIQEAGAVYDRKTAYDSIVELRRKKWPNSIHEQLELTGEYILHSDFDEAANAAENLIKEFLVF